MIIGDDASEDNTRDVVASFSDSRIRYLRHERNVGIYANWNALIERCSGDYICIYHDHDQYSDTILEFSANLLDRNPLMSFVHTALTTVDTRGQLRSIDVRGFPEVMQGWSLREVLANSQHSPIMAATVMMRRTALSRVGPFAIKEYGLCCDKHMWFRLAGEGAVGYVAEVQARIRERERGMATAAFSWDTIFGSWRMWSDEIEEHYADRPSERDRARRRYTRATQFQALTLALRALLLEPPEVWSRDAQRVVPVMGNLGRVLYRIARSSRVARGLLRAVALPLHYRRSACRAWIKKMRAHAYLKTPVRV